MFAGLVVLVLVHLRRWRNIKQALGPHPAAELVARITNDLCSLHLVVVSSIVGVLFLL